MQGAAAGRAFDACTSRRAVAAAVAVGLLVPASAAWNNIIASPLTGILSALLTGSLLVLAGLVACARDERRVTELEPVLLVAGLVTLLVEAATLLPRTPNYLNADTGLLHAAAISLQAGHDPYAANLSWAIKAFSFPGTYTTGGGVWAVLGQPSLGLLATFALISARGDVPAATFVEVISLAFTMLLLYRALPLRVRVLAPLVCVVLPVLPNQALGGATETLLLPMLIVVAHRWRDVGRGGVLGQSGMLRAVALGLAVSTNQLAWLMIPFLLLGMTLIRLPELGLRGAVRIVARYASVAAAVFLVLNGAFIAWSPGNWLHDVSSWFAGSVVPPAQGLAGVLTLFAHVGGGDLEAFGWTVALAWAGLLCIYALSFARLSSLWCVLPCLSLWLGDRAAMSDLIVPTVVLLVAVLQGGTTPAPQGPWHTSRLRLGLGRLAPAAALTPAAIALALALTAPAPLLIKLVSASRSRGSVDLRAITITVTNRSGSTLAPHFQTRDGSSFGGFWLVRHGPRALAPGRTATYVIAGDGRGFVPQSRIPFVVDAVTGAPETVSSASFTVNPPG